MNDSKHSGLTYSACRPFSERKERTQKFKETEYTNYIYKNKLDKVCFQHHMAYKDLAREQGLTKYQEIKHLILLKILNMTGIKEGLLLWFINFLIKNRVVVLV